MFILTLVRFYWCIFRFTCWTRFTWWFKNDNLENYSENSKLINHGIHGVFKTRCLQTSYYVKLINWSQSWKHQTHAHNSNNVFKNTIAPKCTFFLDFIMYVVKVKNGMPAIVPLYGACSVFPCPQRVAFSPFANIDGVFRVICRWFCNKQSKDDLYFW